VDNLDAGILGTKGSLYLTRPSLLTYVASDEALQANTADLFLSRSVHKAQPELTIESIR